MSKKAPESGKSHQFERSLLIVNPQSRGGSECCAEAMERLLEMGPVHALRVDGSEAARDAILELGGPATRVILAGGDGTLNHLVRPVLDSGSTLGVLPLGTANDFARSLQIPLDASKAIDVVLAGTYREVDVGEVNGRLFLNAIGVGLGPAVTAELDAERKSQLGVFAYPVALLSVLNETQPFRIILELDGQSRSLDCVQVTIGNGIHYGGGMTVSDRARMDSGELSVLCIRGQGAWQLAAHAIALRKGHAGDSENLDVFTAKSVVLRTEVPMQASADGELMGDTPLDCRCHPAALKVFAPPDRPRNAMD